MNGGSAAENFFTQEQLDYVNGVEDYNLRNHLLHQVRLRDNLEYDRDSMENKINTLNNLILDMKEKYPNLEWQTMRETVEKNGELPSYIKKYVKEIRTEKIKSMKDE